ncbi:hypothetical protein K469DRAFT_307155 [Zopfia rhizophila CBS 207.26]|uniref:Uncharacterized protein n=1 Tax=Zopfia rhizophila CBS 207.26 TaxID=1314779 RepID=A0A6A6EQL7_9PEZI|nr:hypothetical protein K469DRAFT_307155 [Zopfia rhizophila CBS 207.26]
MPTPARIPNFNSKLSKHWWVLCAVLSFAIQPSREGSWDLVLDTAALMDEVASWERPLFRAGPPLLDAAAW